MSDIILPGNILIAGSTMSGKTYLTEQLIRKQLLRQVDILVILSATSDLSGDFSQFKENQDPDKGPVIQKFNDPRMFQAVIDDIVSQSEMLHRYSSREEIPATLIILDDLVGHPLLRFKGPLDKLSTRSRHLKISFIVLAQRISAVPRTYRLNCKYIMILNITNFSELERFVHECIPRKHHSLLKENIETIFSKDYRYILVHAFARIASNRMYVVESDGTTIPLLEFLTQ